MNIAVTGATGFLGRYLVRQLAKSGNTLRCWYRPSSDRSGIDAGPAQLDWIPGELGDPGAAGILVAGCDAVVHSALWRPGPTFQGTEGDIVQFAELNIVGTLRLISAAMTRGVKRFVFISTCAVHERILDDRPLDECHPLWPASHYGAHKAALEKFVHSYGMGHGFPICALRPTGIYGIAHPIERSKWYELVRDVVQSKPVVCRRGGKEVHAADVAKAVEILLHAETVSGEAFNCCDRYVSHYDVAAIAKRMTGSDSPIDGEPTSPRHEIETGKIRALGMQFGGTPLLEQTIREMVEHVQG